MLMVVLVLAHSTYVVCLLAKKTKRTRACGWVWVVVEPLPLKFSAAQLWKELLE
jgi:hypothetical protein